MKRPLLVLVLALAVTGAWFSGAFHALASALAGSTAQDDPSPQLPLNIDLREREPETLTFREFDRGRTLDLVPNVLQVRLRYDKGKFSLLGKQPVRGSELPREEGGRPERNPVDPLYDFEVRNATGETLSTGRFVVPLTRRTEWADQDRPGELQQRLHRTDTTAILLKLPLTEGAFAMELFEVEANPEQPPAEWARRSAGTLRLD